MSASRGLLTVIVLAATLLLGPPGGDCALMSDYSSLVTSLFTSYNSGVRPRVDDTSGTGVNISMSLLSIQSLDEINQVLTFSCYLKITWFDTNLEWTPASHNGISQFTYPQKYVWLPDITIDNSVDTMEQLGFDGNFVYVLQSGLVYWAPGGVFRTSCTIDVTYYPFDTQECTVYLTTRVSRSNMVDLSLPAAESAIIEEFHDSGTWELISLTSSSPNDFSHYSRVSFTLRFRRLTTYYVVAIIFPVLFLSLTATLVFALPADSGEKMGTSITVLLAFAVYLTIVSDQMPKTSLNMSLLSVWLTMLLGMTAIGVILSVWILNMHFRDDSKRPPGKLLCKLVIFLRRLMCQRPWKEQILPGDGGEGLGKKEGDMTLQDAFSKAPLPNGMVSRDGVEDTPETRDPTWQTVAWTLDRCFFRFFTCILFLVSFGFFVALVSAP